MDICVVTYTSPHLKPLHGHIETCFSLVAVRHLFVVTLHFLVFQQSVHGGQAESDSVDGQREKCAHLWKLKIEKREA